MQGNPESDGRNSVAQPDTVNRKLRIGSEVSSGVTSANFIYVVSASVEARTTDLLAAAFACGSRRSQRTRLRCVALFELADRSDSRRLHQERASLPIGPTNFACPD